ncbi:MAG: hypothetical protein R3D43_07145 [Tepidamorphaceae bacterium]
MIDDYLKVLSIKDVELPEGYHEVVAEAETVRSALAAHPLPNVACHCDPLCENFLDTGEKMWIVDPGIFRYERSDVGPLAIFLSRAGSTRRRMKR